MDTVLEDQPPPADPATDRNVSTMPTERLEAEICELAARLAAAECEWLGLLAEFDRRRAWEGWECRSCAEWLSRACGIGRSTAFAKVAVAHALEELPAVRAAFGCGELSYSVVRALVRVAVPANEVDLVGLVRVMPAAAAERFLRRFAVVRSRTRRERDGHPVAKEPERFLTWHHEDDGTLVFFGRLPAGEGELLVNALQSGRDHLNDLAHNADPPADPQSSDPQSSAEDRARRPSPIGDLRSMTGCETGATGAASYADAAVLLAETMLQVGPRPMARHQRYQATLVLDAGVLSGDDHGRSHFESGSPVSPSWARTLVCSAPILAVLQDADGEIVRAGRTSRSPSRGMRRALHARDGGCRFPGCHQIRFVDAHHIIEWHDGGRTDLSNLIELCSFHHHAIHDHGYTISRTADGLVFARPDGTSITDREPWRVPSGAAALCELRRRSAHHDINASTPTPAWEGRYLQGPDAQDAVVTLLGHEGLQDLPRAHTALVGTHDDHRPAYLPRHTWAAGSSANMGAD